VGHRSILVRCAFCGGDRFPPFLPLTIPSLPFVAPEVFAKGESTGYTKAVDIWSLGCILYFTLVGVSPFSEARNGLGVLQLIQDGLLDTEKPKYQSLSASGTPRFAPLQQSRC
jgi:serine/threonine protein kinase